MTVAIWLPIGTALIGAAGAAIGAASMRRAKRRANSDRARAEARARQDHEARREQRRQQSRARANKDIKGLVAAFIERNDIDLPPDEVAARLNEGHHQVREFLAAGIQRRADEFGPSDKQVTRLERLRTSITEAAVVQKRRPRENPTQ